MGEVDMAARQLKESTQQRSLDWPQYQTWCPQLQMQTILAPFYERGREVSLGTLRMHRN